MWAVNENASQYITNHGCGRRRRAYLDPTIYKRRPRGEILRGICASTPIKVREGVVHTHRGCLGVEERREVDWHACSVRVRGDSGTTERKECQNKCRNTSMCRRRSRLKDQHCAARLYESRIDWSIASMHICTFPMSDEHQREEALRQTRTGLSARAGECFEKRCTNFLGADASLSY